MRRLLRHLQEGGTVCIFPEGKLLPASMLYISPWRTGWRGRVGAEVVEMRLVHGCGKPWRVRVMVESSLKQYTQGQGEAR